MPLGIGHQLLSYDLAWLYQPYLTFLAALLALTLYSVLARVIPSRPLRGPLPRSSPPSRRCCSATRSGAGSRSSSGALLLALIAALLPWTLEDERRARAALPSGRGLRGAGLRAQPARSRLARPRRCSRPRSSSCAGPRPLLLKAGAFAAGLAVLAIPAYVAAVDWLPRIGAFGKETNLGNLIGPLSGWQLFGIWPSGDFRVRPHDSAPDLRPDRGRARERARSASGGRGEAELGAAGLRRDLRESAARSSSPSARPGSAARRSRWPRLPFSPRRSPAARRSSARGRAVEASVVALAIVGGVFWSNALQYHDVWLAPRGQLHELETIGHDFAGQGPALMTNYEPYGARHFLRRLDPEGASELRRRFVYLTERRELLDKGELGRHRPDPARRRARLPDARAAPRPGREPAAVGLPARLERALLRGLAAARSLRRRRSSQHLPLGNASQAAAVPSCAAVRRLGAASAGHLATATRPEAIWLGQPAAPGESRAARIGAGRRRLHRLARRRLVRASPPSRSTGTRSALSAWSSTGRASYTDLGSAPLAAGRTRRDDQLRRRAAGTPAAAGRPTPSGPVALSRVDAREPGRDGLRRDAASLCGRRLDWVEAFAS